MSKDTNPWAILPIGSGLLAAALMLTPVMVQANTEDSSQAAGSEESWRSDTAASSRSSMGQPTFDELDQDGDNYLSESEVQSAQDLQAGYDELDADSDGQVTRTEFAAVETDTGSSDPWASEESSSASQTAGSEESWRSDTATSSRSSMGQPTFDELDQDGDNYLSESEVQSAQDLQAGYDELDADSDGQVTRTEFAAVETDTGSSDPWASEESSSATASQSGSASQSDTSSQQASSGQQQASSGQQQASSGQGSKALEELAQQEDQLSEFVKAVEKAGLADAITGDTKYTVFAPTNDAFSSSGKNLEELMKPENQEELVNVLRAHIVADDVDPEMAKTIGKAKTIGGGDVALTSEGDTLKVGDAKVVNSDIQQGNLRVYAIDGVLEAGAPMTASSGSGQSGDTASSGQSSSDTASSGQSGAASGSAMAEADFDELDQNGDGYLDEQELQAQQDLADQQQQIDSDSDGQISRTEFAAFERDSGISPVQDTGTSDPQSGSDMPPHHDGEQEWDTDGQ